MKVVAIVGGGPAGLAAAEVLSAALAGTDVRIDLFDGMPSVGRKFLLAGKGGLNLTHSEPREPFRDRYAARRTVLDPILDAFDADALVAWAHGLGIETFVGSSGRIFPREMKAAPLLRAWLRRLRERGVAVHVRHRWRGWQGTRLAFATPGGDVAIDADVTVLALGGASWPRLGSDGSWVPLLAARGVDVAPLAPANCGFEVAWTDHFRTRHAGHPVKPVVLSFADDAGAWRQQGELVITEHGIEGGLVYAASARLRDAIAARGAVVATLDLMPGRTAERIARDVGRARGKQSVATHLRRAGIDGVVAGLLRERLAPAALGVPTRVAETVKAFPLRLVAPRPIDEAISTAGGVRFDALDAGLMLRALPGVFCAGEMLDWEAPTGGYLLTACVATGRAAGRGALDYLARLR